MPVTALVDESDDSIHRQLDINVYGVIVGTQLAIERMRPRGSGHIVNIASQAGKISAPGQWSCFWPAPEAVQPSMWY